MKLSTLRLRVSACVIFLSLSAFAAREVVQIADDGVTTVPPNSIATPGQIAALSNSADTVGQQLSAVSNLAHSVIERATLYATNYVVTATVYVRSVGGISYDEDSQLITVRDITLTGPNIEITASTRIVPVITPALDWRIRLEDGAWQYIPSTVTETTLPPAAITAGDLKAYKFTLPKPASTSAYFRVVDNSSGAGGSGYYWVVFGGINIDGRPGIDATIGSLTFKGGILVEQL